MLAARLLACSTLVLASCQSPAVVGGSCARSADCAAPLACRSGRCRTECTLNRDCPLGARCLLVDGVGTCSLDDDVCTSAGVCSAPFLCVNGACANACTTIAQCPMDSTCEPTPDGRASCVASTTIDGGLGDGGSDAGSAPSVQSTASNVAVNTSGMVQVTPPPLAPVGDIVILALDCFGGTQSALTGSPWSPLASGNLESDWQELAYRVAVADESTRADRYLFPCPGNADWMTIVLAGASMVRQVSTNTVAAPYTFGSASGAPGDILLDVTATAAGVTGCAAVPHVATEFNARHWHQFPITVPTSSVVGTASLRCSVPATMIPDAIAFQLMVSR